MNTYILHHWPVTYSHILYTECAMACTVSLVTLLWVVYFMIICVSLITNRAPNICILHMHYHSYVLPTPHTPSHKEAVCRRWGWRVLSIVHPLQASRPPYWMAGDMHLKIVTPHGHIRFSSLAGHIFSYLIHRVCNSVHRVSRHSSLGSVLYVHMCLSCS